MGKESGDTKVKNRQNSEVLHRRHRKLFEESLTDIIMQTAHHQDPGPPPNLPNKNPSFRVQPKRGTNNTDRTRQVENTSESDPGKGNPNG